MSADAGTRFAGIDGTKSGWIVIEWAGPGHPVRAAGIAHIAEALEGPDRPAVIAVDMPIGFAEAAERGGRACDRLARSRLGRRASSVFPAPTRAALYAPDYPRALAINRATSLHRIGLSKQCYGLFPKMREIDAVMTADRQRHLCEAHPEVSFTHMNVGRPPAHKKKAPDGARERLALLRGAGFEGVEAVLDRRRALGATADDVLDAAAVCWTAWRIATGAAVRLPEAPEADARGLSMEIWA